MLLSEACIVAHSMPQIGEFPIRGIDLFEAEHVFSAIDIMNLVL